MKTTTILTSIIAITFAMLALAPAELSANTINLKYYDGDTEITNTVNNEAKTCTYGAQITLPDTNPTKTGYTFKGWILKGGSIPEPVQSCFANYVDNPNDWGAGSSTNTWGTQNGTWTATSASGNIATGISKCSSTSGTYAQTSNLSDKNGQYCWCQINTYTPSGGEQCTIASPGWGFMHDFGDSGSCASNCAFYCAFYVRINEALRNLLFGQN